MQEGNEVHHDLNDYSSGSKGAKLSQVEHFAKRTQTLALEGLREDYRRSEFDEEHCEANPFDQFHQWFSEAQAAHLKEPNALSLATATPEGRPSNRIVLLKELTDAGFVFYTSYASRKGRELDSNPYCAATFVWLELERQVRIEGKAKRTSEEQSKAYFRKRPRGSKLGALASNQSAVVPGRQPLMDRLAELETQYEGKEDIPKPEYWGGICIMPYIFEFWQGRTNRLHDRLLYSLEGEHWRIERLSP